MGNYTFGIIRERDLDLLSIRVGKRNYARTKYTLVSFTEIFQSTKATELHKTHAHVFAWGDKLSIRKGVELYSY